LVKKHGADIVVFGHSHIFFNEVIDGIIFVNPGSAGPRRFHLGRSIAILHLPPKVSFASPHVQGQAKQTYGALDCTTAVLLRVTA
jgi:predicted phosphodiesterase